MLRLETVEDFERIDRALNDPNSKLFDYCLVDYGYCGFCCDISAYNIILGPLHIRCRRCDNDFYSDNVGLSFLCCVGEKEVRRVYDFTLGTDPEPHTKPEKEFFSRKHQRKLFGERLETKITALKKEQRALARQIRQLAKLRS